MKKLLSVTILFIFLGVFYTSFAQEENSNVEPIIQEPITPEPVIPDPIIPDPITPNIVNLYFSEIAWMGTLASSNDEWIEIYNPNDFDVDLNGWVITSDDLSLKIDLYGVILSNNFFILERTDDETIKDLNANIIYTGALSNTGVYLKLIDNNQNTIDEISSWIAGNNDNKSTMERCFIDNLINLNIWITSLNKSVYLDSNNSVINGSPSQISYCINTEVENPDDLPDDIIINLSPVPIIEIQGDSAYMHVNVTGEDSYDSENDIINYLWDFGDGYTTNEINPKSHYFDSPGEKIITLTLTDSNLNISTISVTYSSYEKVVTVSSSSNSSVSDSNFISKSYEKGSVIIESILPNPEGSDSGLELIKLKNTTNESINLEGWKILDLKENKNVFEKIIIPSGSSMQINQSTFNIGLNNENEALYLYDPLGNLIDEISWSIAYSGEWILNLNFLFENMSVEVLEVVDGDTFKVNINGKNYSVRLIGVDTPETVHPDKDVELFGIEASTYLKSLIEGKSVNLNFDKNKVDTYGRILAYVHLDNLFVNSEIIKNGIGYAYIKYPFNYLNDFINYQNLAKSLKLGIWADGTIIYDEIFENVLVPVEEEVDLIEEELIPDDDLTLEVETSNIDQCKFVNLKIDTILPAPDKNNIEYIRLVNYDSEKVELKNWILDDITNGGSKHFQILGGSIASSAKRTFRKDETGISLNNSNDCAVLINPCNEIVDQICYGKTHVNELFSHDGGNYKPLVKVKSSSSSSTKKSSNKSIKQDSIIFSNLLSGDKLVGKIDYIFDEGKVFYFKTNDRVIEVSYAFSGIDFSTTKELIDLSKPVEIKYTQNHESINLVSLDQDLKIENQIKSFNNKIYIILIIILLSVSLLSFILYKKYIIK